MRKQGGRNDSVLNYTPFSLSSIKPKVSRKTQGKNEVFALFSFFLISSSEDILLEK